ncbi:MAG: GlsB/YeaQ/YmgE family stress response membrane protein [Candidatus Saccharimonadales bacterium]
MGFIGWIVIGGLAGWIASKFMNTDKEQGILANIIIGVIGAFVGGFVVNLVGGQGITGFNIWSFVVALLGSVILLWILKAIRK